MDFLKFVHSYPTIHPPIYLPTYLPIYLSIYLIYLICSSIHPNPTASRAKSVKIFKVIKKLRNMFILQKLGVFFCVMLLEYFSYGFTKVKRVIGQARVRDPRLGNCVLHYAKHTCQRKYPGNEPHHCSDCARGSQTRLRQLLTESAQTRILK